MKKCSKRNVSRKNAKNFVRISQTFSRNFALFFAKMKEAKTKRKFVKAVFSLFDEFSHKFCIFFLNSANEMRKNEKIFGKRYFLFAATPKFKV